MKRIATVIGILLTALMNNECFAQGTKNQSCSSPEANQFDFWVGTWNLTWNDTVKGTNIISKELGSCVIHEHFNDPSTDFSGQSFSVYNPQAKMWEQTWVDNQGSYMTFTGNFAEGKMILSRKIKSKNGTNSIQRMVFSDISSDAFNWYWESSKDDGKTWKTNWLIHYKRKEI